MAMHLMRKVRPHELLNHVRPEPAVPMDRACCHRRHRASWVAACLVPVAVVVTALPWGGARPAVVAEALTLAIVAVTAVGAAGPGLLAALVAGAAHVVLLAPDRGWSISTDDVVLHLGWLAAAGVVGALADHAERSRSLAANRRRELRELVRFAGSTCGDNDLDIDALADAASRSLIIVLQLRSCRWHPDQADATFSSPVLYPDGALAARLLALGPDRGVLPPGLEMPAEHGRRSLGHFVLDPDPGAVVSGEERRVAGAIVALFADAADRASGRRTGTVDDS